MSFERASVGQSPRTFLMLQGHPSGFWAALGDRLKADGHRVVKVNFSLGDRVFWGRRPANVYKGRFADWGDWLEELLEIESVTDVIYYGDQLPYHLVARERANRRGLRAWVMEFGYLRPDWLTLERDGMGAASRFPRHRAEIERLAARTAEPDMAVRWLHGFLPEAFGEVSYNLLTSFGRLLTPRYRSDRKCVALMEYLSWLPLLARSGHDARRAAQLETMLAATGTPYNLVALQMRYDYQIRGSSPYRRLDDFLLDVLSSFAVHAPKSRHLVIKLHPLESGLPRWQSRIPRMAKRLGVAGRVHVIRGGDLGTLIRGSSGVVLVNSTVGIHALAAGKPVCAMGTALFDLPGLTHQGGLSSFWHSPEPVDRAYFKTFRRALSSIQIKGSFFHPEGRAAAIEAIAGHFAINTHQADTARPFVPGASLLAHLPVPVELPSRVLQPLPIERRALRAEPRSPEIVTSA